jgi:hypothetical protein
VVKRYEIKKLQSYIGIISQLGAKLDFSNLHSLPKDFFGDVLICDGVALSQLNLKVL